MNGYPARVDGEEDEDIYFFYSSDHIENIEDYRPGGFHLVHLGDFFDSRRFKVLHKLGSGGFATVWLARDTQLNGYVALKILQAEYSTSSRELQMLEYLERQRSDHPVKGHITSLFHHFLVEGPNGSHLCLVSPIAGPSMKDLARWGKRLSGRDARSAAYQVAQAIVYLHTVGVCHGGKHYFPPNSYYSS